MNYLHYDVFTSEPLLGNQLAVFTDGRGLTTAQMQAIAREINFSETTFILPAERSDTDIRMRIFTPGVEMPMAGHPTVGSTFALAHAGVIPRGQSRFVFGLNVGPTPVDLEWAGDRLRFVWMTQGTPAFGPPVADRAAVAAAIGLRTDDLADGLPIQEISCGVPYLMVALRDREAVDRATAHSGAISGLSGVSRTHPAIFLFAHVVGRVPQEPEMPSVVGRVPPEPEMPSVVGRVPPEPEMPSGVGRVPPEPEMPSGVGRVPPEPDAIGGGPAVYSRMFAPGLGVVEDPATGSASGPLGCYLVQHGCVSRDEAREMVSVQGVKMGRASRIHIAITGGPDAITGVKVGGDAVLVARGEFLALPRDPRAPTAA